MPKVEGLPKQLRAFTVHGVELKWEGGSQAVGNCPLCEVEGKFYVGAEEGLWKCHRCGEGGNLYDFVRRLHQWAFDVTTEDDYEVLRADRELLSTETLREWGACKNPLNFEWLLPGYNPEGALCNLYRYVRVGQEMRLWPTPTLDHQLLGVPRQWTGAEQFDPSRPESDTVHICEGPWDGMALWEVVDESAGTVLAVPSCSTFRESWYYRFSGRTVCLFFDNDHPRAGKKGDNGEAEHCPGFDGAKRAAGALYSSKSPPSEVFWLDWSGKKEQYSAEFPDGFDVRDFLRTPSPQGDVTGVDFPSRVAAATLLFKMLSPSPKEWQAESKKPRELEPLPCYKWADLLQDWKKALKWRRELEDVLCSMLAVATSTQMEGDQLFLMVIGDPGSGKSRLCEGMLVSKKCYPLEHLTGFHSGYRDATGKDFSLLARINGKCLITSEADILMSSPHFNEIMSQQRRIFDGTSGASYKNAAEDKRYTGLRTPWIMAGTPALLDADQSRLGDRFLRIIIRPPSDEEKVNILRHAAMSAIYYLQGKNGAENGSPAAEGEQPLQTAFRRTGGYVDYLYQHSKMLLKAVHVDHDWLVENCRVMGEFVADLRARPDPGTSRREEREGSPSKELPTRITSQLVRFGICMAVVMNKRSVDEEVLQRVRKLALDSASGRTMDVVSLLYPSMDDGVEERTLALWTNRGEDRLRTVLKFLSGIKVVEPVMNRDSGAGGSRYKRRWRLTERMRELYEQVVGNYEE